MTVPPIRYMGTKRHVVPLVQRGLSQLPAEPKRFVDLFAGTCSVATEMSARMPVTCADALAFPLAIARPRLLTRSGPAADIEKILRHAKTIATPRLAARSRQLKAERDALCGDVVGARSLLASARHVGNDASKAATANRAKRTGAYSLTTLYFARGYFSTEQAVWLDAIRQAIDELYPASIPEMQQSCSARDTALAAWLTSASRVANSPGHTAQFLSAANASSKARVLRAWSRSVPNEFRQSAGILGPIGTGEWRARNRLIHADATTHGPSDRHHYADAVLYADPPYTKDHYSRYYHVLETLFRYDYPDSHGQGRVRSDRHLSAFCYRSRVRAGFRALASKAALSGAPLLISYPEHGLLERDELLATLHPFGEVRCAGTLEHVHSTMGASKGAAKVKVKECLYLLQPS